MRTGTTSIFKSVFRGLDVETLDVLRQVAQVKSYPAQHVLCHQGEIGHTFYVIVDGRVAVTRVFEDGEERLLAIRGPLEYFGELGLLDESPRMATCVGITPVKVLEVTEEVFASVLKNSPAVAYEILRHAVELLHANDKMSIEELTGKNIELEKAYSDLKAAQDELVEKERLERELEIAAHVQRTLLPGRLPEYPDYHFAAYLQPARQVGGDFYDAIELDDAHCGLLIADVADKSVQAALFMAVSRTLFMVESRRSLSPSAVAEAVHRGLLDVAASADIFVTAFYGVLHRPTGRLTYVTAGQERPLLLRPGQPVQQLAGKGRFLGIIESLALNEYGHRLEAGDRLLLFSDGVTDAASEDGKQYGHRRLASFLEQSRDLPVGGLVEALAAELDRWRGNAPAFDDLTLLGLEVVAG